MESDAKNPLFTVIIPTRERCDTLEHALHTCLIQDHEPLEIIVSDNFSQDRTREVVESFKDSRVRYCNPGKRLGMTENFEFGLAQVRPEGYVLCIGDDDGLLPSAIADIRAVIAETGTSVLRWPVAVYNWPNFAVAHQANTLRIPFGSGVTRRRSASVINDVISFKAAYQALPMLYMYSAVAYDVIKRIKDLSGRFYHSMNPDVYSGFAIAGAVNYFVDSHRPYAIGGASRHSIGFSTQTGLDAFGTAKKFHAENTTPFHVDLVACGSLRQYVMEAFLQARDHLPFFHDFTFEWARLVDRMMREVAGKHEPLYGETRDAVLKLGEKHGVADAARAAVAAHPHRASQTGVEAKIGRRESLGSRVVRRLKAMFKRHDFCADGDAFGLKNVYDASILCHHILKLNDMHRLGYFAPQ
jgi:glycosyltransferase involved in cell wall biosynthesis